MASSAENPPHDRRHHHHLPTPFAATAAPPPTPSSHPNLPSQPTSSSDFLSHLLHRLPPSLSLSLSSRRPSSAAAATPPLISLSNTTPSILSASVELGFFHLADHRLPAHLHAAAESTARALLDLPDDRKQSLLPANWPLGHDKGDDEDGAAAAESFCLDSACATESSAELDLVPLREFIQEMEKIGVEVVEALAASAGFGCPEREKLCSQLWISDGGMMKEPGRVYPYVVGLHYQIRNQKQTLLSDSGWVNVSGRADSVLVTIGDIAQVWSNGKLKKVRGRPTSSSSDDENNNNWITMSVLITLPIESTVSPLTPDLVENDDDEDAGYVEDNKTKRSFTTFSFEDYAWRVYHERLILKDPLLRYRV